MKLARRTFTLEFKADVVRHRKAENLSFSDAGKAFDVLPKLVKDWESLYDKGLLTGEAGRRTVSPEQAQAFKVAVAASIVACRDPKDDEVLELAVTTAVPIIITGDKDVLTTNPFRGIEIISPRQFLDEFS